MFKKLAGISVAGLLLTACGSSNTTNTNPIYSGQPGAYGYGTACLSPYTNSLAVGFNAPQISLSTTSMYLDGQASGGAYTQGQFVKQFYGGTVYITVNGLPQVAGQQTGPLSAQGSITVSGSLVETWKNQLGLNFGWGYGSNPYQQQQQQYPQFCVQRVLMNLVVNPTMVNPQIYSGVVQFQLQSGQSLPPFLI